MRYRYQTPGSCSQRFRRRTAYFGLNWRSCMQRRHSCSLPSNRRREAYRRAFGRTIPLISSRSGRSLGLSSLTLHCKDRNLCNVRGRHSLPFGKSDLTMDSALYGRCSEEHPAESGVVLDYASVRIDHCTFLTRRPCNPKVVSIRRCVFWCSTPLRRAFALVASIAVTDTSEINP